MNHVYLVVIEKNDAVVELCGAFRTEEDALRWISEQRKPAGGREHVVHEMELSP